MENTKFENKWADIKSGKVSDETTLFVAPGNQPKTQRQINLYWYYRFIADFIKDKNYKTGLEMGCGRGTMSLYLHKYENFSVSLLDISPDAIMLAQDNFKMFGADGKFIVASSDATSFPPESFDIIYSIGLLEHLADYKKTLAETYRLLKSGGLMVHLNIPGKWSVQNINNFYKKILKLFTGKDYPAKDYWRNYDLPSDYMRAASECGFRDVQTINVAPFPIFVPISAITDRRIARVYNFIIRIRSFFMKYPFKTNYFFSQGHFLTGYKL